MYEYPIEHVKELRRRARKYGFWVPPDFWGVAAIQLQRCYNGIGPDRWSKRARRLITWALDYLEAPALPHDYSYDKGGGYWTFTIANLQLVFNATIEAIVRRSFKIFIAGIVAVLLCQLFGYSGFRHPGDGTISQPE